MAYRTRNREQTRKPLCPVENLRRVDLSEMPPSDFDRHVKRMRNSEGSHDAIMWNGFSEKTSHRDAAHQETSDRHRKQTFKCRPLGSPQRCTPKASKWPKRNVSHAIVQDTESKQHDIGCRCISDRSCLCYTTRAAVSVFCRRRRNYVKKEDALSTTTVSKGLSFGFLPRGGDENDPLICMMESDESIWNRWEGLRLLGEGVYGRVYLVKNRETGEERAFKRMYVHARKHGALSFEERSFLVSCRDATTAAETEGGGSMPAIVQREVSVLKALRGEPNIIQLQNVYVGSHRVYLSFPFIKGGTLSDLLRCFSTRAEQLRLNNDNRLARASKGRQDDAVPSSICLCGSRCSGVASGECSKESKFICDCCCNICSPQYGMPLGLCIRIAYALLRGIMACHEKRILHRDIKPDNLLVQWRDVALDEDQSGDFLTDNFYPKHSRTESSGEQMNSSLKCPTVPHGKESSEESMFSRKEKEKLSRYSPVVEALFIADFGLARIQPFFSTRSHHLTQRAYAMAPNDDGLPLVPNGLGSDGTETWHTQSVRSSASETACSQKTVPHQGNAFLVDQSSSNDNGSLRLSPEIITLNYRPLEVLLGSNNYTVSVDVWSVGCVILECLTGHEFIEGSCEVSCILQILQKFGTPEEEQWRELFNLPFMSSVLPSFPACDYPIESFLAEFGRTEALQSVDCMDLLRRLLQINPDRRISASEALQHRLFAGLSPSLSL